MEKEYTQEESDALILQEMGLADDNSTTNGDQETSDGENEEVTDGVEEEESTESEETESESAEEDEEETDEEEEEESTEKKPKNKFAKLLAQRNEARKQAEAEAEEKAEALSKVSELQKKLDKLNDDGDYGNEEYMETLMEKKLAEKDEIYEFFDEYDELKAHKKDILAFKSEYNLPLEKATKLYLAENDPSLLLSPQAKAKQKSKTLKTPTRTNKKIISGELKYTRDEFDSMVAAGKIKF